MKQEKRSFMGQLRLRCPFTFFAVEDLQFNAKDDGGGYAEKIEPA